MHQAAALRRRKASSAVEFAIGAFGFTDARCGCAKHQSHARRAVAHTQRSRVVEKAILIQPEPGEAMIARIPTRPFRRQRGLLDAGDAADPARQRLRAEVVVHKSTLPRRQRLRECARAAAGGAGGGEGGDGKRWNA